MLSKKKATTRKARFSKCKICRSVFKKRSMTHKLCGNVDCAIEWAKLERIRKDRAAARIMRKQIRERKELLKTRSDWIKDAQQTFNAYIRARDALEPCISCGRHHQGQYHAGHYLSTGARPGLRFDERNVHKQCQPCNTHLSGNLVLYRASLVRKIGLKEVENLESDTSIKKYSIDDLREINAEFKRRLKAIT